MPIVNHKNNIIQGEVLMEVKMFQMEFGESILLSEENGCLLVDCGSKMPPKISKTYYQNVERKLRHHKYNGHKLKALITHFHEDHYDGFMYLFNSSSIRFDNVFIPHIFTADKYINVNNHSLNVVDYLLMRHYLQNRIIRRRTSFSLLDLLTGIIKNKTSFTLLKRGDTFNICDQNKKAHVLWPSPQILSFDIENLKPFMLIPVEIVNQLFQISNDISILFIENENTTFDSLNAELEYRIGDLQQRIDRLTYGQFDDELIHISDDRPCEMYNGSYYGIKNINDLFKRKEIKLFFDKLNKRFDDHRYCIVFQVQDMENNYLFTGDAWNKDLKKIVTNYDNMLPLYDNYYAVKAPHHGTKNKHYCKELFDSRNITIKKVFISNGDGNKRYGQISKEYTNKSFIVICTNRHYSRCENPINCNSCRCGIYHYCHYIYI